MTKRIRVLRIIARMNVGGPALQVTALTAGMRTDRFEQRLLTGSVEPGEADYNDLRGEPLPARRIPSLGRSIRMGGDARALAEIVREIRSFRPHIVHTHTAKAGVLGRVAALSTGVPHTVHTFHGHLLHGYFGRTTTAAVVQVERALARRTTRLVAVGAHVRDDLLAAGIGRPEQYTVVAPGVSLPEPPPRAIARAALGLPPDVPVIAFVARLTQVKRPDRMLDVVELVRRRVPNVVVAVAGEGPLRDEVAAESDRRALPIRMLGWRGDVEVLYAASDVALLTSDNEGMPVSLIEASSLGVPCVATEVGSVREVVLDGVSGFVRPPIVSELAAAVVDALENGRAMGEAARAHAASEFGRQRLIDDIEAIYEELAGEGSGARRLNERLE